MNEQRTIEAFRGGDEFAFVTLYNRYREPVYAFCARLLLDEDLARDALQETFLRVYENRDRLLRTDAFRSWLYAIARNQCYNVIRHERRTVPIDEKGREFATNGTPITSLERSEQAAIVVRFLELLSVEQREVLVLREYQNLTYEEIAAVTRTTVSSVKSRLFKARRRLATFLEPWMTFEAPSDPANTSRPTTQSAPNPVTDK